MTIGASLFLIALGAILAFAVEFDISGFEMQTAGVILMAVGFIGLLASLILNATRRSRVVGQPVVREQVVEDRPVY